MPCYRSIIKKVLFYVFSLQTISPCKDSDFTEVVISENAKSYLNIENSKGDINNCDLKSFNDANNLLNGDDNNCSDEADTDGREEEEESDVVPEVRIQPASLEVLASRKYQFHPSGGGSVHSKPNFLRLKTKESSPFSRPNSVGSDDSTSDSSSIDNDIRKYRVVNGTASEGISEISTEDVEEGETPLVTINSSPLPSHHLMLSSYRRKSNVNKTASFVVIRTPSISPQPTIRGRSSAPSLSTMGVGKLKSGGIFKDHSTNNSYLNGHHSYEKRPSSYSGAIQESFSSSASTHSVYRDKFSSKNSKSTSNASKSTEKTRSVSCVMECTKPKQHCGFDKFLAESSV